MVSSARSLSWISSRVDTASSNCSSNSLIRASRLDDKVSRASSLDRNARVVASCVRPVAD